MSNTNLLKVVYYDLHKPTVAGKVYNITAQLNDETETIFDYQLDNKTNLCIRLPKDKPGSLSIEVYDEEGKEVYWTSKIDQK